jgi:uncharacterized protein (TIGR04255 family)
MKQREIYQNAPLRLVSLEIRFPLTTGILTRSLWDALEEAVAADLQDVDVAIRVPESSIPHNPDEMVLRRISRDHRRAVTLYAGALTIEVADYQGYEDLKKLTESTLAAIGPSANILQSTRMGLRYINEVKSTAVHRADEKWHRRDSWVPYINSELLGSVERAPDNLCAYANRGTAYFHTTDGDEQVSLNYGIHPEGLVDPEDVLLLPGASGPCFVLDIDASVYGSDKNKYSDMKELIRALDRMHEIVEAIFQWSVTDRTREVFRAPTPDEPDEPLLSAAGA